MILRSITGFHRDEEGHWVAELACGHGRHVRHAPPFVERPWVTTAEGRASRLGQALECVRCERLEIPDGWKLERRTPVFDESSLPTGLRRRHRVATGVWGRIVVLEGALRYRIHEPLAREQRLEPGRPGVVPPGVEHEVEPLGPLRFLIEFWRRPASAGAVACGEDVVQ